MRTAGAGPSGPAFRPDPMATLSEIYERRTRKAGLDHDPAQAEVIGRLDTLRDRLLGGRASDVGGLYLWGPVGRGKSMLLELFLSSLDDVPRRRDHFHDFMQQIHAALRDARAGGADDPVVAATDRVIAGLTLLALDEMEVTDIVDAMIVGRVFERLLAQGVVPVVTANNPPGRLYRDGPKRDAFLPFVRLLEDRLGVVELAGGDDYRNRVDPDDAVYLVPADAAARARMDALWSSLTRDGEKVLDLGHGALVATNGNGAARAGFDALCDRPLGPAAYLRLARTVGLLLIDGIPRLGERRHDAARRFVTLVDVLYDARCGLVASAEDLPERLYPEGEGAKEFVRTASRLHEMQSPDWPGRAAIS